MKKLFILHYTVDKVLLTTLPSISSIRVGTGGQTLAAANKIANLRPGHGNWIMFEALEILYSL